MPDLKDLKASLRAQPSTATLALEVVYDLKGWTAEEMIEEVERLTDYARNFGRPRGVLSLGDKRYEVI